MRASQIYYLIDTGVQLLAGIIVMVWADRIVALFASDEAPVHIDISAHQLRTLTFAVVGIFVLIEGVGNLAVAAYSLWANRWAVNAPSVLFAEKGDNVIKSVIQMVAGTVLILGRETLVKRWSGMRGHTGSSPA